MRRRGKILAQLKTLIENAQRGNDGMDGCAAHGIRRAVLFLGRCPPCGLQDCAGEILNLFPAGFNQLSAHARERAAAHIKERLARYNAVKRVLVIPENHTRNTGYIDNLTALLSILRDAGCEVELGSLAATDAPIEVVNSKGETLREMPLARHGSLLKTASAFCPQLILLNNDLTSGLPDVLRGVSQPIVPRPSQGWHRRRKSTSISRPMPSSRMNLRRHLKLTRG